VLAASTQSLTITLEPLSSAPGPSPPLSGAPSLYGPQPDTTVIDRDGGPRLGGIAVLSVGIAALAGGAACTMIANGKIDNIEKDARAEARYNEANGNFGTFRLLSGVLYATGAAALVAGGWLLWFGGERGHPIDRASLVPTLTADGTPGLGLAATF
jgi:hypothetical protein